MVPTCVEDPLMSPLLSISIVVPADGSDAIPKLCLFACTMLKKWALCKDLTSLNPRLRSTLLLSNCCPKWLTRASQLNLHHNTSKYCYLGKSFIQAKNGLQ